MISCKKTLKRVQDKNIVLNIHAKFLEKNLCWFLMVLKIFKMSSKEY